jgi:hypothetical protein
MEGTRSDEVDTRNLPLGGSYLSSGNINRDRRIQRSQPTQQLLIETLRFYVLNRVFEANEPSL